MLETRGPEKKEKVVRDHLWWNSSSGGLLVGYDAKVRRRLWRGNRGGGGNAQAVVESPSLGEFASLQGLERIEFRLPAFLRRVVTLPFPLQEPIINDGSS